MPEFNYSLTGYDPVVHVRASGREIDASPKATREVCNAIRKMTITKAKSFLESVVEMKQPVAFRRFKKEVGHRSQLQGFPIGAYPVKACRRVLDVLKNLEANGDFKGMDPERLVIIHASVHQGFKIKAYTPRAFGRSSPKFHTLCHIELAAKEV